MDSHSSTQDVEAVRSHIDTWKTLSPAEMRFERLGGLTNQMWKVTCLRPSTTPEAVIYRKFGDVGELVDRNRENYILKGLAEQHVGPKFYAGTEEYRIEKFYDSDDLTPKKFQEPLIMRQMAKAIAELHKVDLNELDKTPVSLKVLEGKMLLKDALEKGRRDVYTPIERKLLDEIFSLASEKEIAFLKGLLPTDPKSIVFSHNDAHSQNVLLLKKNQELMLIDYEYSAYNYRGFDIANIFNETLFEYHTPERPYYTCNESNFPSDDEIREFIQYYLLFFKFKVKGSQANSILKDNSRLYAYVQKHSDMEDFNNEVEELLKEVRVCILLSHYYWILWSIVMSKGNDIKFDYVHFAYKRYELYQSVKRKFFKRQQTKLNTQQSY